MRRARRLGATLALLAAAACGAEMPPPAEAMPREEFVAVYVELRRAALAQGGGALEAADRERILAEHGVAEDDLLTFAEAHGADPAYMKEVWDAVEARLGDTVPPPPTPSGPSASAPPGDDLRDAATDPDSTAGR